MKTSELRLLGDDELQNELTKSRRELLNLRCRTALGEDVRGSDVGKTRRDIARILTVARERELTTADTAGSVEEQ